MMQEFTDPAALKKAIEDLLAKRGLTDDCFFKMLDYTMEIFTTQGLGTEYYGYHNITHELEVTYVSLLVADPEKSDLFTQEDVRYMYAAALLHDFDPQKSVDKPHEENVIRFVSTDQRMQRLLKDAGIDIDVLKVLILRTTYPWSGENQKSMEEQIKEYFARSERAKGDASYQEHVMEIGQYFSLVDRMGGYAMGDFAKAMEMAKMNAHSLGWKPSLIVRRSVAYFEEILSKEADASSVVLGMFSKQMRKNFFDTVLSFMMIRQKEITIQADAAHENLKVIPTIAKTSERDDPEFIKSLYSVFLEMPKPLQFRADEFEDSIRDTETILTTLRVNSQDGRIVGFAKGGPLERYSLRPEITDENYGLNNTIFLEPISLEMGYWGLKGGSEMRHMFIMQAIAKQYKNLTSFALREVIHAREGKEGVEFVAQFDPERWDYYRIRLEKFQ